MTDVSVNEPKLLGTKENNDDATVDRFHDDPQDPTDVLLSYICNSILSDHACKCYMSEIFSILFYLRNNQRHALSQHGTVLMDFMTESCPEIIASQLLKKRIFL
jgi:hypothetical protein